MPYQQLDSIDNYFFNLFHLIFLVGPALDETESLTEFEEIEKQIAANIVGDSDGDLSDIPDDMEIERLALANQQHRGKIFSS